MANTLLDIINLRTSFRINRAYYAAVDNVSLSLYKHETLAIVGESGSGKSSLALSVTRLLNPDYSRVEGIINYGGQNLATLPDTELNKVRGGHIGMIFQDPLTALNPLMKIGSQIEEGLIYHSELNPQERKARALELLQNVGIHQPDQAYGQFPHELSGGMRQRAMIAMALSNKPALLIADEPTTALDVTIQAQILDLLRNQQAATGTSTLLITHDLGVVAETAHRVAVMYAGQVVELAPCAELFQNPLHPYTKSLLASIPGTNQARLHTIQGMVPSLQNLPREGCRFAPRMPELPPYSHQQEPTLNEAAPGHFVLCTCYKHITE
ncbi:MAG: ABC transporter ATP-binding protein [Defluviitaleaceae bacterium]|nr:ABC transporter ATP-binding protein [Defluviitaleaceae bacterium]